MNMKLVVEIPFVLGEESGNEVARLLSQLAIAVQGRSLTKDWMYGIQFVPASRAGQVLMIAQAVNNDSPINTNDITSIFNFGPNPDAS